MNAKFIIEQIKKGIILPPNLILGTEIDNYLDQRDSNEHFLKSFGDIYTDISDIADDSIADFTQLHQLVFSHITDLVGVSDLSCYIAEDFEAIIKSKHKGIESEFIEEMLAQYLSGKLPS